MRLTRDEITVVMTNERIKLDLHRNVPADAKRNVTVGDGGLMFREKPVAKWVD